MTSLLAHRFSTLRKKKKGKKRAYNCEISRVRNLAKLRSIVVRYLNDKGELGQDIRKGSHNLLRGEVEFEASGDVVLANVKGVESSREIVILRQQFLKHPSCGSIYNFQV